MKTDKHKSGIIRLLELSDNRKGLLILSAITVTIHALMMMVPYLLIFFILKVLMDGRTSDPDIRIYLIWAFVSLIVSAIMVFASAISSHIAAFNILYKLRCKISDKLGRLPMGYLQNRSSGALKKILSDDVERVEKFIAHNLPDTIKAFALPLVTLGYLFFIDWRLAIVSLLPLLVFVVNVPAVTGSNAGKERVKKYHSSLEEMKRPYEYCWFCISGEYDVSPEHIRQTISAWEWIKAKTR